LDTGTLSLKNLKPRPVRTAGLAAAAAILAVALFSGLTLNLRQYPIGMAGRFSGCSLFL
jgi:hypothetical protein